MSKSLNYIRVTDVHDPDLRPFSGIRDVLLSQYPGYEHGLFLAESPKVIERALDSGIRPVSLLSEEHWLNSSEQLCSKLDSACPGMPFYHASLKDYQEITGFKTARGVLCLMERPEPTDPVTLLAESQKVAILEDITNYTNIGAIFRSAAALGVDAILVTPSCHDPLYRRAARVSMGTVFQVPWAKIGNEQAWAEKGMGILHEHGFKTIALALRDDSYDLGDPEISSIDKLAMVLGTEGEGLSPQTIDACDYTVRIPMDNEVDSLNVAAASSVAFWELVKRPRLFN